MSDVLLYLCLATGNEFEGCTSSTRLLHPYYSSLHLLLLAVYLLPLQQAKSGPL